MAHHTLADDPHGHVPVMRDRMAELLAPAVERFGADAVLIDGTLGAGGHTEHFLTVFPDARVIGVDRDPNALAQASERLAPFGERFTPVQMRFDAVGDAIANNDGPVFDTAREHGIAGALFDLGVSSMQLDQEERGFSYRGDAPLDMRMDPTTGITAAEVLNTYSHGDLARVLKTYGDERFAGKIASAIVAERERVLAALAEAGWQMTPSQANFVWFPLGERTADFVAACTEAGLSVRPYGSDGVRVTIGETEANDRLIEVAREFLRAAS